MESKSLPSALPDVYYAIFRWFEPTIGVISSIAAFINPKLAHDNQGPWPNNTPPAEPLPQATQMVIYQLSHVCFLISILNFYFLGEARNRLRSDLALQEKIVGSYLGTLLLGDVAHLSISLWAWGENRWDVRTWTPILWTVVGASFCLGIPRLCWVLGIGRYVHKRDGTKSENLSAARDIAPEK